MLSHGPWPASASPAKDPTNRASGNADAIEFGTRLFFDQRLSGDGKIACASCHVPERNWTDNIKRGIGVAEVDRNTPTIFNLRGSKWYGWDGAADSLWYQSLRPILDKRELAASPAHVAQLVRKDEDLSCRYRKTFGAPPAGDDEAVFVNVGKALAAFQETLSSGRTPFVHGALAEARRRGAFTVLLCFNPALARVRGLARVVIAPDIGPEILTGSTRLKSGTATKLLLNIFTTLAMVRLGKVVGNLMVDLNPSNIKLRDRATRIVRELTGCDTDAARAALEKSRWVVKDALRLVKTRR